MRTRPWLPLAAFLACSAGLTHAHAQGQAVDRDTKVRNDRKAFEASKDWIYNDLEEGVRASKASGKPMMVVFRCIPCEACQEFDDDVARRDPVIRDLLDRFVCVRIVQANTIDLTHFQYDFDQSFAVVLMNPDKTVYGRFATRSDRPESEDISLQGLRRAMQVALGMHANYEAVRPLLAGKQVKPSRYKSPLDYPSLSGRFAPALNYEGQVARSCMHCHQVREAERMVYRSASQPIPDDVLFPYPDPSVLGLKLDPTETAKVERVAPGSSAEKDGVKPGDTIASLAGQEILSIADVQWVLQNAPKTGTLPAQIQREGHTHDLTLRLHEGWRRGNISWRATTWDLRRMGLGGMKLDDLTDAQRKEAKLPADTMALKVGHVGEFGAHSVAKKAGFQRGDVIVAFDGQSRRLSESDLLAYTLQQKRPGDEVTVQVLRNNERKVFKYTLQ